MKNKYLLKGVQALIIFMLYGYAKEDTEDFIVIIFPVNEFGKETYALTDNGKLCI